MVKYTNLSYDYIATFFLFMLLVWYVTEKKVPLKSFKQFFYVILCAFMAAFLETAGYIIVRYSDVVSIRYAFITTSVQMLFIHSFIMILTHCLLSMVHVDVNGNKMLKIIFTAAGPLIALLTLPNLFIHKWSFDLPNGKYIAVGIGNILYIIDAVMVIICLWVFIKRHQDLKFIKPSISIFLIIVGVGSGIAQLMMFAPMFNMVIATLCMVMYLYQQSPDAYNDEITGQFNRTLFGEYLQEKFIEKKPFSVVVIDLVDFRMVNQSFGVACGDNGVVFSLDDYGSGYANICQINHMPFQYIKLDKEIVWEAFKNDKARITLEHTVSMLNALDLNIVAEGIETEEMRQVLTAFGCIYLQGWYFSKAVSQEAFLDLIHAIV